MVPICTDGLKQLGLAAICPSLAILPRACSRNNLRRSKFKIILWGHAPIVGMFYAHYYIYWPGYLPDQQKIASYEPKTYQLSQTSINYQFI